MVSPPALAAETLLFSIGIPFCSFILYVLLETAFQATKLWLLSRRLPGLTFYSSEYRASPAAAQQRLADLNAIAVKIYEGPAACLLSSSSSSALSTAGVNGTERCAVCLAEYEVGDEVKVIATASILGSLPRRSSPALFAAANVFDKMPERADGISSGMERRI